MKHGKAEHLCSPPQSAGPRAHISSGLIRCRSLHFLHTETMASAVPGYPFAVDPTVSDMTTTRPFCILAGDSTPCSCSYHTNQCVLTSLGNDQGYSKEVQGPERVFVKSCLPRSAWKEAYRESRTGSPTWPQSLPSGYQEWMSSVCPKHTRQSTRLRFKMPGNALLHGRLCRARSWISFLPGSGFKRGHTVAIYLGFVGMDGVLFCIASLVSSLPGCHRLHGRRPQSSLSVSLFFRFRFLGNSGDKVWAREIS